MVKGYTAGPAKSVWIAGADGSVELGVSLSAALENDIDALRTAVEGSEADIESILTSIEVVEAEASQRVEHPPKTDNQSTAQTDTTLWDPAEGKRIMLTSLVLSTDTAMNIFFEVGADYVVPPVYLPENGSGNILFDPALELPVDGVLTYTSSAAGNHSVAAYGWEAD